MIELVDVCKRLGDFNLNNINLKIDDNEYFVILGPTGTGKTVILETIAGLYKPDKGEILFDNLNISNLYPEQRNIGFVYQDYALFPHLKVKENILFGLTLRKTSDNLMEEKLAEVTELLGINHLLNRYPATLSGGEQQRVAIARILVLSPKILLLDEPMSALDPRTKQAFLQELRKIHQKFKTTTIHITHDFNEALVLADRIAIMKDGQIIQVGTPEEIFYTPKTSFVANFVGVENIFTGETRDNNGEKTVEIGNTLLKTNTDLIGEVKVTIRPEDITLTKENITIPTQNIVKCSVKEIVNEGALVKIKLASGMPLTALISKYALDQINFDIGDDIYAVFKTTSVHVFKSA